MKLHTEALEHVLITERKNVLLNDINPSGGLYDAHNAK